MLFSSQKLNATVVFLHGFKKNMRYYVQFKVCFVWDNNYTLLSNKSVCS